MNFLLAINVWQSMDQSLEIMLWGGGFMLLVIFLRCSLESRLGKMIREQRETNRLLKLIAAEAAANPQRLTPNAQRPMEEKKGAGPPPLPGAKEEVYRI